MRKEHEERAFNKFCNIVFFVTLFFFLIGLVQIAGTGSAGKGVLIVVTSLLIWLVTFQGMLRHNNLAHRFKKNHEAGVEEEMIIKEIAFWNDMTYDEAKLKHIEEKSLTARYRLHKLRNEDCNERGRT